MPLTAKGKRILSSMMETYKSKDKAEEVFYAMINEGKLKGVEHKVSKKVKRQRRKK